MTSVRGAITLCFADRMLAFLFCLCLAVVGVVGQLTDADFAKIGYLLTSELGKRDERLYAKFDALETKFDALNSTLSNKFDALETKFDALNSTLSNKFDTLNSTLSAQIGDLKTYFTTAFSDSH